jgi:hypothetical protein
MSKKDKLLKRLEAKPTDFTYHELKTLLKYLGFVESNQGKTSGSGVTFWAESLNQVIMLHKPHPGNILKEYQIKQVITALKKVGVI